MSMCICVYIYIYIDSAQGGRAGYEKHGQDGEHQDYGGCTGMGKTWYKESATIASGPHTK